MRLSTKSSKVHGVVLMDCRTAYRLWTGNKADGDNRAQSHTRKGSGMGEEVSPPPAYEESQAQSLDRHQGQQGQGQERTVKDLAHPAVRVGVRMSEFDQSVRSVPVRTDEQSVSSSATSNEETYIYEDDVRCEVSWKVAFAVPGATGTTADFGRPMSMSMPMEMQMQMQMQMQMRMQRSSFSLPRRRAHRHCTLRHGINIPCCTTPLDGALDGGSGKG